MANIYNVHTEGEICPIYANSKSEAASIFKTYNPRRTFSHIELRVEEEEATLRTMGAGVDEHEFLVAIIQAVEGTKVEQDIIKKLVANGFSVSTETN